MQFEEENDEAWQQFIRRRAGRKAASRAMEVRARVLDAGGASQGNANPSNSDAEATTPHEESEDAGRQPTPPIDPRLLDTPDLDRSTMTLPSPPVPQTPDAPARFLDQNSSPLSNVTDGDTPAEKTGRSLKRKRPASTTDRPKTRAKRRAARA
jgi:hypothetical protein